MTRLARFMFLPTFATSLMLGLLGLAEAYSTAEASTVLLVPVQKCTGNYCTLVIADEGCQGYTCGQGNCDSCGEFDIESEPPYCGCISS